MSEDWAYPVCSGCGQQAEQYQPLYWAHTIVPDSWRCPTCDGYVPMSQRSGA